MSSFTPSERVLKNYARVMVDFALGKGKGVKRGEVVFIQYDLEAKPLALVVFERVLEIGAQPMTRCYDEDFEKKFLEIASENQLRFLPKKYTKSLVETIDHRVYLMAPKDPFLLKDIDPKRIILANQSKNYVKKLIFEKEDMGKLTWSLCLYGTEGMAKEAGLSLKDFWQEIINACFLDFEDPLKRWQEVFSQIEKIRQKLNQLPIDKIHLVAKQTDLWITLGEKRIWQGGRGANIPSFEIFTSPDWRGTKGTIYFNFPLYRYGNLIKDIYLEFQEGRVIKAKASRNEKLIQELIGQKNADKIGEFSLTDKRFSRINRFMANTLYDENFGGKWGNSHLALGSSYHDCFLGDKKRMRKEAWEKLGFNNSIEHTDIINTERKQVEVILRNGVSKVIYKDGKFLI
ncbi:MAG: aminopeptidase [Patescibacteria group bacterium]|nr:aminopeptidase [Patescibacteria group bacterium]